MAKQIIWSPLAKEALKDLLISSQERDGNKRCGGALYTLFQNALYPCHAESVYRTAHRSREHTVHHSASRLYASLPAQSPED